MKKKEINQDEIVIEKVSQMRVVYTIQPHITQETCTKGKCYQYNDSDAIEQTDFSMEKTFRTLTLLCR